ncbi:MAG: flavin reductase family protein [Novosphingobium sp.]|nr:flavin reductase family protein [Novosphingobium sp.]
MSEMTIEATTFRQVLGYYPTGVSAITALDPAGNPTGMIVGTFTSVSLDPPLVGFLPDKSSSTWPLIERAGHFCVNVLASDQQRVCKQLAAKGGEKFAGVEYRISAHDLPVIAGALASIECRLHSVTDAGDHWFVLGRVVRLEATRDADPMLFFKGRYGGFAGIE